VLRTIPLFHDSRPAVPQGCEGGYEALETTFDRGLAITRVFIGARWFVHAQVVHPFNLDPSGRVTIREFKGKLASFLAQLESFFHGSHIRGPFCLMMEVRDLKLSPKVGWVFPAAERVALPRPCMTERLAAEEAIDTFHTLLLEASRYG
jgi:hypothetical protein